MPTKFKKLAEPRSKDELGKWKKEKFEKAFSGNDVGFCWNQPLMGVVDGGQGSLLSTKALEYLGSQVITDTIPVQQTRQMQGTDSIFILVIW